MRALLLQETRGQRLREGYAVWGHTCFHFQAVSFLTGVGGAPMFTLRDGCVRLRHLVTHAWLSCSSQRANTPAQRSY